MRPMTRAAWAQFRKAWQGSNRRLTDDEYCQLRANWENWNEADIRRRRIEFEKRAAKQDGLTLAAYRAKRAAARAERQEQRHVWYESMRLIPPMREPLYLSFKHYLDDTTEAERKARWRLCARRHGLPWQVVQQVFEAARGRCCYCNSLAVERTPQRVPWTSIGRRLGSLEHKGRHHVITIRPFSLDNLAWACMWCNTHPEERIPDAECHGAIGWDYDGLSADEIEGMIAQEDADFEMLPDHEAPWATAMWRDTFG
jgi:hypothetical protein